jgi:hypothetical protein
MPTREEKVAQIETVLRQRFFPYIPKNVTENRKTWTEQNHDTNRLTRALAAYVLVGIVGLDDVSAAGAVIDDENDGGIDAIYFDREHTRLILVQSKFKTSGTAPAQDENLKTINGVRMLLTRRFPELNAHVQRRQDEIEEALDTGGIVLHLVHAFLGENINGHVGNDLNALMSEVNGFGEQFRWEWATISKIYQWLIEEQAPSTITEYITLEYAGEVPAPRKAIYGQISAIELANLVQKYGKTLFERNIRHYLGSIGVNKAITKSVKHRPNEFFYLNNGITAVADKIEPAAGMTNQRKYKLTNISIVNGAQTAGAIVIAGDLSADAKVLMTVIEIGEQRDDLGLKITRARNHQTAVRGVDFAALDPNQERIRQELSLVGITYYYRPSADALVQKNDAATIEDAALALACMSFKVFTSAQAARLSHPELNAVDFVVIAKKEIGRLWGQEGAIYKQLFNDTLSGVRLWRLICIYRFIDQILSGSENSQPLNSVDRLFYRHARYFIMAFVAQRIPQVMNRPDPTLNDVDKTVLSQTVNEISELVLQRSRPLLAFKGYLSIFRNLTDAQPLADSVLDAIRQQAVQSPSSVAAAVPVVAPANPDSQIQLPFVTD